MLKHLSETETLKRFIRPPDDPPTASITPFPSSPLDLPPETFQKALERREKNHLMLIQWIRKNLHPDIDYGRTHIFENCKYARAGVPYQCRDFSHMSMLTLWKGGAEKVLGVLGLSVHFPNLHQYELACVHKQEITQVVLKCELKTLNGKVVAEGSGARHLRQDGWNLNTSIKMACKSAMVDATIRVAELSGLFLKTHRHTLKNNLPDMGNCNYNLTPQAICNGIFPEDKPITEKQKHLIQTITGRRGFTTEGLNKAVLSLFNKNLDDLNRVEASRYIQHLNG